MDTVCDLHAADQRAARAPASSSAPSSFARKTPSAAPALPASVRTQRLASTSGTGAASRTACADR
eukprot:1104107-Pyramimonas_sp.AAC.1